MATTTQRFSQLGKEVPVGRIDSELRALWDNNDTMARASLTNVAVYSEHPGSLEPNSAVIAEITREHACRALLIASEPGAGRPSARAWITAHCQLDSAGQKSVCSEQVAFLLSGKNANMVRNIVFAHLDSDLPLVFWWQGEFSQAFDDRLYSLIDRLIIDSACWDKPGEQFDTLCAARKDAGSRFILHDLNWARLLGFRLALAGIFDDALAQRDFANLNALTVTYRPGARLGAAFLVAWAGSRAGWTLHNVLGTLGFSSPKGAPISLSLAEEGSAAPGDGATVSALRLESPSGTYAVSEEPGGRFLRATIQIGDHHQEQLHPTDSAGTAALVADQLRRPGRNPTYFKLLPLVRELL